MNDGLKMVRILLVEDNPDDVDIARRALKKTLPAHELTVKRDGQEAVDYLIGDGGLDGGPPPDLILLDLNLPKVNGIEVLQRIKQDHKASRIPVIMLTASERDEDIAQSYKLGSNTYISKPVQYADFLHAIEVIAEYWLSLAKLPKAV